MEVGPRLSSPESAPPVDLLEVFSNKEVTIFGVTGTFQDLAGMCPIDLSDPRITTESKNEFVVKTANEAGIEIEPEYEAIFSQILSKNNIEPKFTVLDAPDEAFTTELPNGSQKKSDSFKPVVEATSKLSDGEQTNYIPEDIFLALIQQERQRKTGMVALADITKDGAAYVVPAQPKTIIEPKMPKTPHTRVIVAKFISFPEPSTEPATNPDKEPDSDAQKKDPKHYLNSEVSQDLYADLKPKRQVPKLVVKSPKPSDPDIHIKASPAPEPLEPSTIDGEHIYSAQEVEADDDKAFPLFDQIDTEVPQSSSPVEDSETQSMIFANAENHTEIISDTFDDTNLLFSLEEEINKSPDDLYDDFLNSIRLFSNMSIRDQDGQVDSTSLTQTHDIYSEIQASEKAVIEVVLSRLEAIDAKKRETVGLILVAITGATHGLLFLESQNKDLEVIEEIKLQIDEYCKILFEELGITYDNDTIRQFRSLIQNKHFLTILCSNSHDLQPTITHIGTNEKKVSSGLLSHTLSVISNQLIKSLGVLVLTNTYKSLAV